MGQASYNNAHYLAEQLVSIPGVSIANAGEFFNEFTMTTPSFRRGNQRGAARRLGIIGGYDLASVDPALANSMLVATTELTSRDGHRSFVDIVRENLA